VKSFRIKLSILLPSLQLALAVFLLQWGKRIRPPRGLDTIYISTPSQICAGINAPATVFALLERLFWRVDHPPPAIFGFGLGYLFFLLGVALVWHLVGRGLDQRMLWRGRLAIWTKRKLLFVGLPLTLIGAFFLYGGIRSLLTPWGLNNYWGSIASDSLAVLWSLFLIGIPASAAVRLYHTERAKSRSS
jgi:hypothetical protein